MAELKLNMILIVAHMDVQDRCGCTKSQKGSQYFLRGEGKMARKGAAKFFLSPLKKFPPGKNK